MATLEPAGGRGLEGMAAAAAEKELEHCLCALCDDMLTTMDDFKKGKLIIEKVIKAVLKESELN